MHKSVFPGCKDSEVGTRKLCWLRFVLLQVFNMKRILFFLLQILVSLGSEAQNVSLKDSVVVANCIMVDGGIGLPMGDLADRFGIHGIAGGGWQFKSKQNFLFGTFGHYVFGSDVKEEGLFDNISNELGAIIGSDGELYRPALFQQGFDLMVEAGAITPLFAVNPNSGLAFTAGVGYFQHNIQIFIDETIAPQLAGDYSKGYDRLTGGVQFSQFIGYYLFSNKAFVNFRAGFEFRQAITRELRTFRFDGQDNTGENRLDMMVNFKATWILPVYQKPKRRFYSL